MALEGTLRDFSLADIFQLIGLQRKTGVLTLRAPEDTVTVSFLDGKVVGADSMNKRLEDRLGQVLRRSGVVSQEHLERALKIQGETLERLGHVLIANAMLSRDELRRALEQQILQIIYRTFRWQDGDYHFSQETSIDFDAELVQPVSAESILMEGARMLDEWPIIEKKVPSRDMVFVRTPSARQVEVASTEELEELEELADFEFESEPTPRAGSGRVRISPVERDVLALVDGANSVEEIIRRSIHGEFETCKALYTTLTRSLIREASREELAGARRDALSQSARASGRRVQVPWLALLLLPLLVASILLSPKNPLNPLLGPNPKPLLLLETGTSAARMQGVWRMVQARAAMAGTYPENLAELVRDGLLPEAFTRDPWGRPYRYILREQSVLLAGNTPEGLPDPNLILSQHLASEPEDLHSGPGLRLVNP